MSPAITWHHNNVSFHRYFNSMQLQYFLFLVFTLGSSVQNENPTANVRGAMPMKIYSFSLLHIFHMFFFLFSHVDHI